MFTAILKEKLRSAMIEVGDAITKRLLPKIKSINEELEFLGDIGWDNIGMFLANNIGEVLNFAGQVVSIQAQILGLKISGKNLPKLELMVPGITNHFTPTRVLIVLEENANLELIQTTLGSNHSYQNHLIEISLLVIYTHHNSLH